MAAVKIITQASHVGHTSLRYAHVRDVMRKGQYKTSAKGLLHQRARRNGCDRAADQEIRSSYAVFKACNVKLISLVGVMEVLKQHWEEYTAVPCVKGMLSRAFPDFSEECSMSGSYGNKCLIDNALP
ncbi:uncharacterized protein [Dermacentor albipictus]|uniref:uncharacterized protein isoform X3 n=1 Tax=Dermacentor albipictus TaxID=60249 RepID=UPI0031FDBE36